MRGENMLRTIDHDQNHRSEEPTRARTGNVFRDANGREHNTQASSGETQQTREKVNGTEEDSRSSRQDRENVL